MSSEWILHNISSVYKWSTTITYDTLCTNVRDRHKHCLSYNKWIYDITTTTKMIEWPKQKVHKLIADLIRYITMRIRYSTYKALRIPYS